VLVNFIRSVIRALIERVYVYIYIYTYIYIYIHTKHINTLCGQKVELLNVKLVVHIVTTGIQMAVCVSVSAGS